LKSLVGIGEGTAFRRRRRIAFGHVQNVTVQSVSPLAATRYT
jgi:hypothetical protein